MTTSTIVLPAGIAAVIITARSLASKSHRMPYPYEYASMAIIYAGAGLLAEANGGLGAAVAWGYLVALVLTPGSADLIKLVGGGLKPPPVNTPTPQGGTG